MESFASKYSSWYVGYNGYQYNQYKRLEALVLQFNSNMKSDVTRAKDKYNLKTRGIISDKTGLNLTYKAKDDYDRENKEKNSIPIEIVDYVPVSLLEIFSKFDDNLIELLLHFRQMKASVVELSFQIRQYEKFENIHKNHFHIQELENAKCHLQILIKEVEKSGILEAIKRLGVDLLGAYFFVEHRIELYWLCIGFASIIYDVPVEYLTLVVLIHELTHGYTHIGFDKDGHNWHIEDFKDADLKIVEGFAQFYTEILCKDYFDFALPTFTALLDKQSPEYTEYKKWFVEKEPDKYEKTRRILIKTRSYRIRDYDEFIIHLQIVKSDF